MKLSTKILLILSGVSILSVAVIGLVGISFGKKTMEDEMFNKLTAIRELKANRIEAYFEQIRNQLLSFSEDYMVVDAMNSFHAAFEKLDDDILGLNEELIDKSLGEYYQTEFLPRINKNSEEAHLLEEFYPTDFHTKFLQYHYISKNLNKTGEKQLLTDAGGDFAYSGVHSHYHPIFKSYLEKFGFYDIFMIDLQGHVVYSVYKEVDFATSLIEDVYNETNFARVYKEALNTDSPEFIKMVDFETYPPSYNGQASFVASPIFEGDRKIGVLVFQLPIDRINNIMTDNSQWEKVGLGKSGETYIVGADLLLRNQSRFLIEDKENYLGILNDIGTPDDVISKIDNLNTSIGLQKVETQGVIAALKGDTGISIFPDYRGIHVLSSYRPLTIKDMDWAIMSELDKKEAYSAITGFVKNMIIWLLLLIALIPVVAYYFARGLVKPLEKLTDISKQMAAGKLDIESGLCRNDEIGVLACSFDTMSASLKQMMDKLEVANSTLEEKVILRTKEVEIAHYKTQSIIDNANDAIITIDEKQNIVLFNPAASEIFGYENEEIIGKSLLELLPEEYRDNHINNINAFKQSPESSKQMSQRSEVKGKRKNGELFYAEISISKQKIENQYQFTAFLKDVSVRKKAEKRLKSQSAALKSAANGIVITNINGIVEWVNPAFTKLTGYSWREVVGKNPRVLNSGKHDKAFFENMWKTILKGEVWHDEVINKKKNGELYYEEMTITPILNDKQEIVQFVAIKQDVTVRKELEKKIEEANLRMEDELNVGRDIQMSMLPLIFPAFPDHSEFNIFALLESAREVGGDFYDFYFIDENKFLFTVADVAGKGVPSALFMAVCKTLIKSRASEDSSPSSIITHVNDELSRDNPSSMFVTLFLCIIDLSTGKISYTNAGHNPPHIKRVNGDFETLNTLHGPVVGAMEDFAYGEDSVILNVNDYIILFTDGVNEGMDKDKNLYSDARLVETLKSDNSDNIKDHVNTLFNSVMEFQGDAEQADDITILGFEYLEPLINKILFTTSIILKNQLEEIDRLNEHFEEFCETNQVPPKIFMKFNIVFDELINNIVSYAYKDDEEHNIEVIINITEDHLVVSIEDDGIAFNPFNLATPDTSASIEDRDIGGLGVHLVRNLMDNFSYKRFVKKNMTTLYKNIK
ncbi:MAG: SpoIIE family protein phosphatase [Draconibacterium sp.]|nr:SpoIIE family protein phosphatase [Draconibacterium sp.]